MNKLWLILFLGCVDAHVFIGTPQLSCDPILPAFQGCLRGQRCSSDGVCEVDPKPSADLVTNLSDESPAVDEHGSPEEESDTATSSTAQPQPSAEGRASRPADAPNLVFGPARDGSRQPPGGAVTENGTCGVQYNNTVCGDWDNGSCCSPHGWCGNATSHCGSGCQSGPCLAAGTVNPVGPMLAPPPKLPGKFRRVGHSGVPAMAAALMPNGRVVFLDKIENYTQIALQNGYYAYSAEYDPATHKTAGLSMKTNPFCCGGAFLPDGRLLSVGGNGPLEHVDPTVRDGFQGIRYLTRQFNGSASNGRSWEEPGHLLSTPRWYPSVQVLPNGSLFVASGSANGLDPTVGANNNPTYEILDRDGYPQGESIGMPILERNQPYYMYPFLHLLKDGTIFAFVSKSAEIFDVETGTTVKTLPDLRGDYRTYPNTGGSVLLPLSSRDEWDPQVMVCGGGAFQDKPSPTDPSCGRIRPLSDSPEWELDSMPKGRTMVDGILLPDGTVLWINGAHQGAQGYSLATDPVYDAWIYDPNKPLGARWANAGTTRIARLYHSTALLLLDGTVMVAGSSPLEMPVLVRNSKRPDLEFVTEFRVEIYTPHYLRGTKAYRRPRKVKISATDLSADGHRFSISFTTRRRAKDLRVVLYHGGFVTHSLHMNHRMLYLDTEGWQPGKPKQTIRATMPPNSNVAPPGPYVVYVVVDGIPSVGQFVTVR